MNTSGYRLQQHNKHPSFKTTMLSHPFSTSEVAREVPFDLLQQQHQENPKNELLTKCNKIHQSVDVNRFAVLNIPRSIKGYLYCSVFFRTHCIWRIWIIWWQHNCRRRGENCNWSWHGCGFESRQVRKYFPRGLVTLSTPLRAVYNYTSYVNSPSGSILFTYLLPFEEWAFGLCVWKLKLKSHRKWNKKQWTSHFTTDPFFLGILVYVLS